VIVDRKENCLTRNEIVAAFPLLFSDLELSDSEGFDLQLVHLQVFEMNFVHQNLPNDQPPNYYKTNGQGSDRQSARCSGPGRAGRERLSKGSARNQRSIRPTGMFWRSSQTIHEFDVRRSTLIVQGLTLNVKRISALHPCRRRMACIQIINAKRIDFNFRIGSTIDQIVKTGTTRRRIVRFLFRPRQQINPLTFLYLADLPGLMRPGHGTGTNKRSSNH
jgi:hypothetical protein